jgi:hypothetical protein
MAFKPFGGKKSGKGGKLSGGKKMTGGRRGC